MKFFRLVFVRIIGYIQNFRLVFFLFFIGAVVSSFAFIYFYGNSLKYQVSTSENSEDYRIFEVYFSSNEEVSIDQLHVMDQYNILDVGVTCLVDIPEKYDHNVPENIPRTMGALLNNGDALSTTDSSGISGIFNKNELNKTNVVIDKIYGNNIKNIEINGINFPVSDTLDNGTGVIYAPINTYMQYFGTANYITFLTANILNEQEIQEAKECLEKAFPAASEIVAPDIYIQIDKDEQTSNIIATSIMYIVSLFSFLFLLKYILDCNNLENSMYYLIGAKRTKVFLLIFTEAAVLSIVSTLIAIFIHSFFYEDIFQHFNMTQTPILYRTFDYIFILLITVSLSLITTIPFIFASLRDTPINLKNICEE